MRLLLLAVSSALLWLAACGSPRCVTAAPAPISAEPLGGVCRRDGDCASGLSCVEGYAQAPSSAYGVRTGVAASLCTRDCSVVACPTGSTCTEVRPSSGAAVKVCVPTCAADAECETGTRRGKCEPMTDGGVKLCVPMACSYDGICGSGGWTCVDTGACVGGSAGSGISDVRALDVGWCKKGS